MLLLQFVAFVNRFDLSCIVIFHRQILLCCFAKQTNISRLDVSVWWPLRARDTFRVCTTFSLNADPLFNVRSRPRNLDLRIAAVGFTLRGPTCHIIFIVDSSKSMAKKDLKLDGQSMRRIDGAFLMMKEFAQNDPGQAPDID